MENNREKICPEKFHKRGCQSSRETKVEMFRLHLQWSKTVKHVAKPNKGNQRLKHFQNHGKRMDMGKNTFILVNHFSLLLSFNKSEIALWMRKQIYNTIQYTYSTNAYECFGTHNFLKFCYYHAGISTRIGKLLLSLST